MWRSSIESFFSVEPVIADRLLKLSQKDIAIDPVGTHKRIKDFLDLDVDIADATLTEFFSKGSNSSRQTFTKDLATRAPRLEEQEWSDEDKQLFAKTCGPLMEKLGYTM